MSVKAWHFSKERKLAYGDGRQIRKGRTHKVKVEPILCCNGLHGSIRALDALSYAPGSVVSRVIISGDIDKGDDKLCGTERTYLWVADAEDILREFARWCALEVIHLWDAPDIVIQYLKTGDESIRAAAWDAAWAAARAAARDAARAAAWDAARDAASWDAARAAAWDAARAAAWDAARAAARAAARDAARAANIKDFEKKANRKLTAMLNKLEPK